MTVTHTSTPVSVTSTLTPTTTPAPVLPVNRFEPLPPLLPISLENAANLTRVASFESTTIEKVFLNDSGDRIIFQTYAGVQFVNMADFTVEPFAHLPISPFGELEKISSNGKLAAVILPVEKFWNTQIAVIEIESDDTICTFPTSFIGGGNGIVLNFHQNASLLSLTGQLDDETGNPKYGSIVWDLGNCQKIFEAFSNEPVWAITDDARYAAVTEAGQLFIYTISTGTKTPVGNLKDLRGANFLPDGKSILITYSKGNAVFDIASGEMIFDFPGNMGTYYANYQLSEDGKWIFIGAYDQNRVFDVDEKKIYPLPNNPSHPSILGNGLLGYEDYILNIKEQKRVGDLQPYGKFAFLEKIMVSADGNYVVISSHDEPFYTDVLDLSNRKILYRIDDYHDSIPLPGMDGFIATSKGKTAFFNFSSNQPLKVIDLDYTGGTTLENGSIVVWDDFGRISLIDTSSQSITNNAYLLFNLSQTPVQHLPSAWEQENTFYFDGFLPEHIVNPIAISHDQTTGIQLVNDMVEIFRVREDNLLRGFLDDIDILKTHSAPGQPFTFKFSLDDKLVAGVFPTKILIWSGVTGEKIQSLPLPNTPGAVYAIDFSPDGSKILFSHGDSVFDFKSGFYTSLRIFDIQSGMQTQNYSLKTVFQEKYIGCHTSLPFVVTQDGTQVITLTENCRIGIFDFNTWELKQEFGNPYSNATINFALSPDNHILAVAYEDKLELWDISAGELIGQFMNPAYTVYAPYFDDKVRDTYTVAFSPDGRFIGTQFSGLHYFLHSITTLWGVP
jgi:WD40 repeat protein